MPTGLQIIEVARSKIGQEYWLGSSVPLDDMNYAGPWDCAELCSWAVYQISGIIYGCLDNTRNPAIADAYTGSWKRDSEQIGEVVSWQDAAYIPGAMLLRRSRTKGHIAISVGDGNSTVEARGREYGVLVDQIAARRWNTGVLVPGIEYARPDFTTNEFRVWPEVHVLRSTDVNLERPNLTVELLQRKLADYGLLDRERVDGRFGLETEIAVHDYQVKVGLTPDGEVDAVVAERLGLPWPPP